MKLSKNQRKRLITVLTAAIVALALVVTLVCLITVRISQNSVRGEWTSKTEDISYVFKKNSELTAKLKECPIPVLETVYTGEINGDYSIDKSDKTLVITLNYYNKQLTQKYSYEIKNKILALKNLDDGVITVYYKQ